MLNSERKKITIVIPSYNEEQMIDILYERLVKLREDMPNYAFEFLFVNDGSKDKTLEKIKNLREKDKDIFFVSFSRNFGKEIAMLAGMDYSTGDAVCFIDADLQDPPELIKELVAEWEKGYDDVYARRKSREGESFLKKFTAHSYYRIVNNMSRYEIQVDTGDFRLLDRRVINALKKVREESRNTKNIFSWVGYKKKEVLFDRPERVAGETKWNYKSLVNLAIDGITSVTTRPLRIASFTGFITLMFSIIYLLIILISNTQILPHRIVIFTLSFLFALNFIFLGIIGEYLARVFVETKDRPVYLVDEYTNIKEKNEDKNTK